jgi:hypothetical protein
LTSYRFLRRTADSFRSYKKRKKRKRWTDRNGTFSPFCLESMKLPEDSTLGWRASGTLPSAEVLESGRRFL